MPTAPTNANANHGIISTRKQRSLHLIAHIIRKRRDNPPTDSPEEAINVLQAQKGNMGQ